MAFIIVILLAAAIYLFQSHYFKCCWDKGLSVSIAYSKPYAEVGESVELIEHLENKKNFPIPILYLKYKTANTFHFSEQDNGALSDYYYRNDTFSIMGHQQITRKLHFTPLKRGYFLIDSFSLVSNDLFLRQSFALVQANHSALYVYPKRLSGQADLQLVKTIIGDMITKSIYEDPLSFKGIRDYTFQDEMRHINWKATAKSQKLMVNTYFDSQNREVTLMLNFDTEDRYRVDRMQEQIIRVAATLASSLIQKGFHVGCLSNAPVIQTGMPLSIESGAGDSHLHTLLRGLSSLNNSGGFEDFSLFLDGEHSVFKKGPAAGNYLVLSNYCRSDLLAQIEKKQKSGYPVSLIYIDTREGFRKNKHDVNHSVSNLYCWEVNIDEPQPNII